MAELDGRIAALEARIANYEAQLDAASSKKEKSEIRQIIIRLLDEKMAQTSAAKG